MLSVFLNAHNKAPIEQQYQWDSFGNPQGEHATQTGISLVKHDQLYRFAGNDYRFDASGNQISCLGKGNKQQRIYNALNQLTQLNYNGQLTHYEYDALGRRSAKITEQGRTDFIWDNNQLIGEHQQGKYTWFIYQPDTFTPIALIKSSSQNSLLYYYHLDQLGTPLCLTDKTGQQVWRNDSDVFGALPRDTLEGKQQTANKIENPLRFQGQYFDEESKLHYNRFRYYCPQQQRFINQDPIGLVGGINHYSYAPNPVNWVDPFGLSCKEGDAGGMVADQAWLDETFGDQGIKPVTILPIEWAAEGIADAAEQLVKMLDTGPTLAGAATMAIALIPGKVFDKALAPVVKKLDGFGVKGGTLKIGESTTYANHNKRAQVGDNLEGNHIPAVKQIIKSEEIKRRRKLTKAEKSEIKRKTGVLVEPKEVHATGATYRGRNTQKLIEKDASDLKQAAYRDTKKTKEELLDKGYNNKEINAEITKLHEYNESINVYDKKRPIKLSTDND